jgi:hypothetical protein
MKIPTLYNSTNVITGQSLQIIPYTLLQVEKENGDRQQCKQLQERTRALSEKQ